MKPTMLSTCYNPNSTRTSIASIARLTSTKSESKGKLELMRAMAELEPYRVAKNDRRARWNEVVDRVNAVDSGRTNIGYNSMMPKRLELFNRYKSQFTPNFINSNSGINHFHDDLEEATFDAFTKYESWKALPSSTRTAGRRQHYPNRARDTRDMMMSCLGMPSGSRDTGVADIVAAVDAGAGAGAGAGDAGDDGSEVEDGDEQQQPRRQQQRPADDDGVSERRTRIRRNGDTIQRAVELLEGERREKQADREVTRRLLDVMEGILQHLTQQRPSEQ
ncbi:unnamed protein product [Absidia cylindrospora]